jgi:hypothetical protein
MSSEDDVCFASAGIKRTSVSPPPSFSTNKRLKQDSAEQMKTLVAAKMAEYSSASMWDLRMDKATVDESKWKPLMASILFHLGDALLANTDEKDKFSASLTLSRAMEIVNSFSDDDYEEWKKGVQKGVVNGDWTDLVEHRKCHSNCVLPSQLIHRSLW